MDANVIPIIVAFIAAAPGIYAIWRQVRKDRKIEPIEEVSAGVEVSSNAAKALEVYSREVVALREELSRVRAELDTIRMERAADKQLIDDWRIGIERLIAQMKSHEMTPVWTPNIGMIKR